MTDLLSRPRPTGTEETTPRPLVVAAAVGSATAVGVTLAICMAVGLIGWFLADAGAHGQTTDALRIGADGWLLGHGADVLAAGVPVGITPFGLTLMILVAAFRCGRWAGADSQPVEDDRLLGKAVVVGAAVYVVLAIAVAELATHSDATPSIPRTVLGALVVSVCSCGLGLAAATGRLEVWWARLPGYVRSAARGALTGALLLVAAGAAVVAVALVVSFNQTANVFSGLGLSFGDALMMLLVCALLAPNAALFATSYLVGPGFAIGAGTSVTTTAATLGPLPAFPLLAALPAGPHQAGWMAALVGVPPLCALAGAALAQRRYAVAAWDSAALRGFASGFGASLVVWFLAVLAGGPMGTGRMAHIGVPGGELLVTAVGGMSLGGLVGGLAMAAWQRRRAAAH